MSHRPQRVKQLIFHIIDFVESEKHGPAVPLYNVDECLIKMLNILLDNLYFDYFLFTSEKFLIRICPNKTAVTL